MSAESLPLSGLISERSKRLCKQGKRNHSMFQDVRFGIFQLNEEHCSVPRLRHIVEFIGRTQILTVFPLKVAIKR